MRKIFLLFIVGLLVTVNIITVKSSNVAKAVEPSSYAEYVSIEHVPIIDGKIDDCWKYAESFFAGKEVDDVQATIKIMWNESGLYYLAQVKDKTTNPSDRCNFWVSENYIEQQNNLLYPQVDGAYFLCLTPTGENKEYKPGSWGDLTFDMAGKYELATLFASDCYTVELFVPTLGSALLTLDKNIGFNVSIDDYLYDGASRNSYVYWEYKGDYWEFPSALSAVILVDESHQNGTFVKEDENQSDNEINESEIGASDEDENLEIENSQEEKTNKKGNGCSSSVETLSIVSLFILLVFTEILMFKRDSL